MMERIKYNRIENTYRVNPGTQFATDPWYVTEKVHGANFAFYYDGADVRVASRNQFVTGQFYNCQEVIDKYEPLIKGTKIDCDYIVYFGELYGPGIQKGVDYGRKKDFLLFDIIRVMGETKVYHTQEDVHRNRIFETVPLLFVGPFPDAMTYQNDGRSLIYPDAIEPNVMEGVVLKPNRAAFLGNGKRVIFKNKNGKFAEKRGKPKKEESPDLLKHVLLLEPYITLNRFDNLFAKQPWGRSDFGKFIQAYMADVFEDAAADGIDPWKSPALKKAMGSRIAMFCKEDFLTKAAD